MHLMDLLSMILRCNGFAGFIRPAAEHQAVAVTLGEGEREGGRERDLDSKMNAARICGLSILINVLQQMGKGKTKEITNLIKFSD